LVSLAVLVTANAERNHLKPTDFEPLTELPWKTPGDTSDLRGVLEKIFREPDQAIRYPVLAEYLRAIPVKDLGRAFDTCVLLEGTQVPEKA